MFSADNELISIRLIQEAPTISLRTPDFERDKFTISLDKIVEVNGQGVPLPAERGQFTVAKHRVSLRSQPGNPIVFTYICDLPNSARIVLLVSFIHSFIHSFFYLFIYSFISISHLHMIKVTKDKISQYLQMATPTFIGERTTISQHTLVAQVQVYNWPFASMANSLVISLSARSQGDGDCVQFTNDESGSLKWRMVHVAPDVSLYLLKFFKFIYLLLFLFLI